MGKVITSTGLNEFISTGKVEEIKADPKPKALKQAPPLETKPEPPAKETAEPKAKEAPAPEAAPDADVADDDDTRAEMERSDKLRDAIARKNATINRKHREMREAREAQTDAEEFAKAQWNEKRLAEERAASLERENADLKKGAAPAAPKAEKGKPDPAKFYDDKGQFKAFEYAEELASYAANKAVEDDRQKQIEERKQSEAATAEATARARVAETVKKHPDFEAVVTGADVKTHSRVLEYLAASEHIGDVSYYLAKNPAFVERINQMHPLKAIAEIGKLEATFEKPPEATSEPAAAKVALSAPAPIKPLQSQASASVNVDPAKMSYKELRAYERNRARGKR